MEALAVIGMGVGVFLMYEAYKNQLDPLTVAKSILTTGAANASPGTTNGAPTGVANATQLKQAGVAPTTILHAGTGATA